MIAVKVFTVSFLTDFKKFLLQKKKIFMKYFETVLFSYGKNMKYYIFALK